MSPSPHAGTGARPNLRCPHSSLRCRRLYLPLNDSWLECRRGWGHTYSSRTLQNYKDSPSGRGMFARLLGQRSPIDNPFDPKCRGVFAHLFGTTQRDWAFQRTYDDRIERQQQARERWSQRRRYLKACVQVAEIVK